MSFDKLEEPGIEYLLFSRPIDWDRETTIGAVFFGPGKSRHFPSIPRGPIFTAMERGHLDPSHRQGNAPQAGRLLDWSEHLGSTYKEEQLEIGFIGHLTGPRYDHEVKIEGLRIEAPAEIPETVEREAVKRFDPDYFVVDESFIELRWD